MSSTIQSLTSNDTDEPSSKVKKWSYDDLRASNYKDGGVRRITLQSITENISESYDNLKTIFVDHLKPYNFCDVSLIVSI